jgi:hypothetical protein
LCPVDLNDDRLGGLHQVMGHADGTGRYQVTVSVETERFNDGDIDLSKASPSQEPRHPGHLLFHVSQRSRIGLCGEGAVGDHRRPCRQEFSRSQRLIKPRCVGTSDKSKG